MLGVPVEMGCCSGRCWGDTKGLAGVTKGMTGVGPAGSAPKEIVVALVSGAGTRTHRHWQIFLLDGHREVHTRVRHGSVRGVSVLSALSSRCALANGGHARVQRRELVHHTLILIELVGMNGLRMLTQVVEARELLPAVAGEWSLSSVFPVGVKLLALNARYGGKKKRLSSGRTTPKSLTEIDGSFWEQSRDRFQMTRVLRDQERHLASQCKRAQKKQK